MKDISEKLKSTYSFIFITCILLMFFLVMVGWMIKHINAQKQYTDDVSYDGSTDYPIYESYEVYQRYVEETLGNDTLYTLGETDSESKNVLSVINRVITKAEDKIEKYTNATSIKYKYVFIEAKKRMDKLAGLDMTVSLSAQENDLTDATDIVVETKEGQLGFVQDDVDISESLDNLIAFGLDMESEDRNFIFFLSPNKYADSIPFTDYSDKYYGIIADECGRYGIDLYDYGEILVSLGMTERDIYYNTDHHWKPSTGIIASGLMCGYLNDNYGYNFDLSNFELDKYNVETYKGIFLGSLGKKVSKIYAEPDDFEVYYPKYDAETNLTVYRSIDNVTVTGTIGETLFDYEMLESNNLNEDNAYPFYSYGSQALLKIHNNLVNDGSHILIVKTSFANCMVPYLASVVENLEVIDLRHFKGSLRSYIDDSSPDTVIVLSGLTQMETESAKGSADSSEAGSYDFR
jgi:hypothetical protein